MHARSRRVGTVNDEPESAAVGASVDPHPWRLAVLLGFLTIGLGMLASQVLVPLVVGYHGWVAPEDAWPSILAAQYVSNGAFAYMTCREIRIAGVSVRALRVTYVGELGWELYVPIAGGLAVWDAIWEAGAPHSLRPVGYRAVDSLRLEKGYRYWSADVTPDYTPYEAGQGFCVKADRKDFQGREALLRQREQGLSRKLSCLILSDNTAHPLGNEPVTTDGRVVSRVTSGGIGYTVQESIAYAYLPMELTATGTEVKIELDGRSIAARVEREPRFDPTNSRIKA